MRSHRSVIGAAVCAGVVASLVVGIPAAVSEEFEPREPRVWEAPAEVNRTPSGGEPEGEWPDEWGAEPAQERSEVGALTADDDVAAPGLGVQEHYGFEEFEIDDRQSIAVNLGNGNLVVRASDVTINGPGLGLTIERFYNGLSDRFGSYGPRWSASTVRDVGLEIGSDEVVFRAPSGFRATFTDEDDEGWEPPSGLEADLAEHDSGNWSVTYRGNDERLVFNDGGHLIRHEDRNKNMIEFAYNTDNTIASITDTAGRVTEFDYVVGKISQITDSAGRVTSFSYNATDRLAQVETPDGATRTYGYTSGRLTSITSGQGHETTIGYDGEGRVTSVNHGGDGTTEFSYASGETTITDAGDNDTFAAIDGQGRVTSVTDPLGRTQWQEWTPASKVASQTDATGDGGNVTSFEYDEANNPTQVSLPTGAAAQATYTSDEDCGSATQEHPYLVKCATDDAGNETTFEYDTRGNLMSQSDTTDESAGRELSYERHGTDGVTCGAFAGQVCSAIDGEGGETDYAYDTDGNITSIDPPGPLPATTYTYDSVGRVSSSTDGRGITTSYSYDELDRLTAQETPQVEFTHGYDDDGRMVRDDTMAYDANEAIDWWVLIDRDWDARGNQTGEQIIKELGNDVDAQITMGYDSRGNMTSFEDAAGEVTYAFDAASQLTEISTADSTVGFDYDANGQEIYRSLPGGAVIERTYDASGRLSRLVAVDGDEDTVVDFEYSFENTSDDEDRIRIQSRTDHVGVEVDADSTQEYAYDSLNRLVSVTETSPDSTNDWLYGYDDNGNRTFAEGTGYEYNASNQITQIDGSASGVSYDDGGNVTERSGEYEVDYNEADQATEWTLEADEIPMTYLGSTNQNRLSAEVSFGTQYEIRSPLGLAYTEVDSEFVGREESRVSFLRTPEGELIGVSEYGTGERFVVTDHLGSIVGIFGDSGELGATRAYHPWGEVRSTTGDFVPVGFAGGETSTPNGLVKFEARYYDPELGVFTQMDPAGQEDNPYLYATGDPINNADPTGLSTGTDLLQFGSILGTCAFVGSLGATTGGAVGGVIPIVGNVGGAALGGLGGCAGGAILEGITGQTAGLFG